jgi:hypothetical protein
VATIGSALTAERGASARGARPLPNPIQRENALPGTAAWALPRAPAGTVEGYASQVSVRAGDLLRLHVSTAPAARYRIEIFRIGWYRGLGARRVACVPGCSSDKAGTPRPVPAFDPGTGYLDAAWPVTDTVRVAAGWTSGYYLAELVLTGGDQAGTGSWIPFVVREPAGRASRILVQAPVNTWQAYNDWGGRSLYFNFTGEGDNHVSFDRPYSERVMKTAAGPANDNTSLPQDSEFPLVRFLERGGYDVSYSTDVDADARPGEYLRHRLVMLAGHGEYWTKGIRDALERARDSGTNLAFIGANTGFWQMRYENGRRTIVEYRKTNKDPEPDPALKTVMFSRLVPSRPECTLLGIQSIVEPDNQSIGIHDLGVNPAGLGDPWFRGTGFTATSVLPELVGYEWDLISPGCPTPPLTGLFHYEGKPDFDSVRYTAPSGARVFSAGTLRFSWGLDDRTGHGDGRLRRFMQNALDDLTRPAPPAALQVRRLSTGVLVAARRLPDARPGRLLVYAHAGTRPFAPESPGTRVVCAVPGSSCLDRRAPTGRPVRYLVAVRDRWGSSYPVLSPVVR